MRGLSFKPQYRQAPPRSGTPPPPAYEPLSPIFRPSEPSPTDPAGRRDYTTANYAKGADAASRPNQLHVDVGRAPRRALPAAPHDAALPSAPLPRANAPYSPALGSPIDALADAAVSSLHASPTYSNPSRRVSHGPLSPTSTAHLQNPFERVPRPRYQLDAHYSHEGRPAKRARSEYFSSPPHHQQYSRPITSHIPGYNVEQMVDSGVRMYQGSRQPGRHRDDNSAKRLSDAQLLLDFQQAAAASYAQQVQASPVQRWSVPHLDVPDPRNIRTEESTSRRFSFANPNVHCPEQSANHPEPEEQMRFDRKEPLPPTTSKLPSDNDHISPAVQTHTPPDESFNATAPPETEDANIADGKKQKKTQGWPKGKPRGSRAAGTANRKKRSTPKPKEMLAANNSMMPDQLHSPQSLPAEAPDNMQAIPNGDASTLEQFANINASRTRRYSISDLLPVAGSKSTIVEPLARARSVPLQGSMTVTPPSDVAVPPLPLQAQGDGAGQITVCSGCHSSDSEMVIGEGEQWINCDGCKGWFHFGCAGFQNEREVRDVDKYYCEGCSPKFGKTTKVRKSGRAHTAVDYAGLNEGILKTSDDNPEHHYIQGFKNGDIQFAKDPFARLPPELVSADFFGKTNGFKEPVLITAASNPRPYHSETPTCPQDPTHARPNSLDEELYGYGMVRDDGQDKLDMVIPQGLTVRRVAELYGPLEKVDVIDVKSQEGEDKRWNMSKWADYYEQKGEKPVRNVISLEVSQSKLGRLIRRPKVVRDLDLQDSLWPQDDKINAPKVQFYCLMSVADCYTDFHIDFGGSSVYYHIVKGRKTFFFIPPTKQNLKKYEDWCLSPRQSNEFLGHQVKECYRVDLFPGDTMLIPSGWIHAVWTPEDSLVIGGNFLTRIHYGMQIKVAEIEKNTKVAKKFRYPFFQKIMWLSLLRYLQEDPLPTSVEEILLSGGQFPRSVPVFCEPTKFGPDSDPGAENYNRRYYSKAELEGLPDLANYIWRTVMISLGRIEGITTITKNAVTKSIPKGHGEPIALARRFAMWIAWKRGNETIPTWAHPDAPLPEMTDSKKVSSAVAKQKERESWNEAIKAVRERQSIRTRGATEATASSSSRSQNQSQAQSPVAPPPTALPTTGLLQSTPPQPSKVISTPKTSQLGPKRIACDACRKRRIRCKHKDELLEPAKPVDGVSGPANGIPAANGMSPTTPLSIAVKRRDSESYTYTPYGPFLDVSNMTDTRGIGATNIISGPMSAELNAEALAFRSGRVKACPECRKSKRRCIHDEYGNVDPVKASEVPVPRGSTSKKRRISDEGPLSSHKKVKREVLTDSVAMNGDFFPADEQTTPSRATRDSDTMALYSPQDAAQQALSEMIPIDPALEMFNIGNDGTPVAASSNNIAPESIIDSIEQRTEDSMEGSGETMVDVKPSEPRVPTAEPLTPAPPTHMPENVPNGIDHKPTPPLTAPEETTANISPARSRAGVQPVTPQPVRVSRVSSSSRKKSRTPYSAHKANTTPKSASAKKRRDSKETEAKAAEQKLQKTPQAMSSAEHGEDEASLALAMRLQMEEHGLRRRSK